MTYDALCRMISSSTGQPVQIIKEILQALPMALMQDKIDAKTKTPLGTFRVRERLSRVIQPPSTSAPVRTKKRVEAVLKPGMNLKVTEDDPRYQYYFNRPAGKAFAVDLSFNLPSPPPDDES